MTDPTNITTDQTCRKCFWMRLVALALWTCMIAVLSLVPNPPQPPGLLGWDKLQHAGAYGLLALLLARFIVQWPQISAHAWWLAFVGSVGFGLLLECLQLMAQTGRRAEWADVLADGAGALAVCVLFRHVASLGSHKKEVATVKHG